MQIEGRRYKLPRTHVIVSRSKSKYKLYDTDDSRTFLPGHGRTARNHTGCVALRLGSINNNTEYCIPW